MDEQHIKAVDSDNKYSVPAIVNTFKILEVLSRKKYKESTLTEIANAVGLTPPTCYRILQQLKDLSLVRFDNNKKRYTLGTYLVVLGDRAKENLDFISIAEPYLEELSRLTGLTSLLVSRVDEERLTQIAKHEVQEGGVNISIGRHFNILDDDSYGKCFLAFMESDERDKYIKKLEEQGKNRDTIEAELETYRKQGYAIRYSPVGTRFPGIFGISCPIYLEPGNVELCISVVGMTAQLSEEEVNTKIAPLVRQIANSLNHELHDDY